MIKYNRVAQILINGIYFCSTIAHDCKTLKEIKANFLKNPYKYGINGREKAIFTNENEIKIRWKKA